MIEVNYFGVYVTALIATLFLLGVIFLLYRLQKRSIFRLSIIQITLYGLIMLLTVYSGVSLVSLSERYAIYDAYIPVIENQLSHSDTPEVFKSQVYSNLLELNKLLPTYTGHIMIISNDMIAGDSKMTYETRKLLLRIELRNLKQNFNSI